MNRNNKIILALAIVFFIIGMMMTLIGSLFKIQHWPGAGAMLTAATGVSLVACILFIVFVIKVFIGRKSEILK